MNILTKYVLIFMIFVLVTGCSLFPFPTDLLQKPTGKVSVNAFDILTSFLPTNHKILVSEHSESPGAVHLVDLDHDHQPEIIGVIGLEDDLGMSLIVLKKIKNQWKKVLEITEPDRDHLDYLAFRDVTGDQLPEIIFGASATPIAEKDGEKSFSIYQLKQNFTYSLLLKQPYLTASISDLTGDKQEEVLLMSFSEERNLIVKLYQCPSSNCNHADTHFLPTEFSKENNLFFFNNFDTIEQVITGQVTPNQKGVLISVSAYKNKLYTVPIVVERGKLKNLLAGKEKYSFQVSYNDPFPLLDQLDNNKDGVAEIKRTIPQESDILFSADQLKGTITIWSQLDQKYRLKTVKQIYLDEDREFVFTIPPSWDKSIKITEIVENGIQISYFTKQNKWKVLYKLYDIPANIWPKHLSSLKERQEKYEVIKKTNKKIYVVTYSSSIPTPYKLDPDKWGKLVHHIE